jgi:hypothetical protein
MFLHVKNYNATFLIKHNTDYLAFKKIFIMRCTLVLGYANLEKNVQLIFA